MHTAIFLLAAILSDPWPPPARSAAALPTPELVEVQRIWGQGPHNSFADLLRFKSRWYCALREGRSATSTDGAIRLLTSDDGVRWQSAVLLPSSIADLRAPKLTLTPDNKLMLTAGAVLGDTSWDKTRTVEWFSSDGRTWGEPAEIGDPGVWLWRPRWEMGRSYGIGHSMKGKRLARLYVSRDGTGFETLVENLYDQGAPADNALLFLNDNSALCLLARDGGTTMLGRAARPPYRAWTWKDTGVELTGPQVIRLEDGRFVAAGRANGGTALFWLDPETGGLKQFLALPSGDDSGAPGLALDGNLLWVSYHSNHEGKTAIYLAKVKVGK